MYGRINERLGFDGVDLDKYLERERNLSSFFSLELLFGLVERDPREYPYGAFMEFIGSKILFTKRDIMEAMGLSKKDYETIFQQNRNERWVREQNPETESCIIDHCKRKDLLPYQMSMSKQLLSWRQHVDRICEGTNQEDEDVDFFWDLLETMRLFFLHISELRKHKTLTR